MPDIILPILRLLDMIGRELLLFAGFWFIVGLIDELLIDFLWFYLRFRGRSKTLEFRAPRTPQLRGKAAILVPCWQEASVIGHMLAYSAGVWKHSGARFFVGCYSNDPDTVAVIDKAAAGDPRIVRVLMPRAGPTTKADCLNHAYGAMVAEERVSGEPYRFVVMHDAEDQVHPLALDLIEDRLERADFVQLPVMPLLRRESNWISGHYADEFAENHGKTMVVRDWLRVGLPAAGVGCAFTRQMLTRIADQRGADEPFAAECLTEDYELGLLVHELGGRGRFVRAKDKEGELIATREYFPSSLSTAVRQKARWVQGIACQGWDRMGWTSRPAEIWMRMRDRRGPLTSLVLASAYLLIIIALIVMSAQLLGFWTRPPTPPLLKAIVVVGALGFVWRSISRAIFTAHWYGWVQGLCSIIRLQIGNIVAILAGRRAMTSYVRTLRGGAVVWDKTAHDRHPNGHLDGQPALSR